MPKIRQPNGPLVNGTSLLVKDPNIDAGLFTKFRRVPGLASFTLPDETGTTSEQQTMDGPLQSSETAGVGTIVGAIAATSGHATHRLLGAKRRDGQQVTVTIIKPAVGKTINAVGTTQAGGMEIAIPNANRAAVKSLVREGMLIAIGDNFTPGIHVYSDSDPEAADDGKFRPVLDVEADGSVIRVEAVYKSAIAAKKLHLRQDGVLYESINVSVNGFGDGDFQAGGRIAANIAFAPDEVLPLKRVEWRLIGELAANGRDYSGAANAAGPYDGVFA